MNRTEIQNKIKARQSELKDYQEQLPILQNEYEALSYAYDCIQLKVSEFYDLYPCADYVISNMLGETEIWEGDNRDNFEYDFPGEYQNGLGLLGSDSLDARDWIGVEMGKKEREIKAVSDEINALKDDIYWLNRKLQFVD